MRFNIREVQSLRGSTSHSYNSFNSALYGIEVHKESIIEHKRQQKILEFARQMPEDSPFYHDGTVEPGPYPHTNLHGEIIFNYPDGQKIPQCPLSFVLRQN